MSMSNDVTVYSAVACPFSHRTRMALAAKGIGFETIYWPDGQWGFPEIADQLQSHGINIHRVKDILPGYAADASTFRLHRYDGHPNAAAHDLLADYVCREILR